MPTDKPSVYVHFGEQAWERPEFDYCLHGSGAQLLALPPESYDKVLLFPFGYAASGNPFYEFERATRFCESVAGIGKLLSVQRLLEGLASRGKTADAVTVYFPGWFSTNSPAWQRLLRPPVGTKPGEGEPGRETFEDRLWRILMYFRHPRGEPRCKLAFDASGNEQRAGSIPTLAIGHAEQWGFSCLTEGHPHPGSALQYLPSITTAWHALESPASYLYPTAIRSILCNNSSGIGRESGVYAPGQPIGRFGLDHRGNYVPQWRREGRTVYAGIGAFGPGGEPPTFWNDDGGVTP